jgi:MFS family permease
MTRTPDSARGRVSATANAVFGGAQGISLLLGGVIAIALSPRQIYAVAGLLGLAATGVVAVAHAAPDDEPAQSAKTSPAREPARSG